MLLTQRIRKSCPQSEIFSLGGQYYSLGQSSVYSDWNFESHVLPQQTVGNNIITIVS